MKAYKREFIEFLVTSGALRFGDFETKSGRRTPYFINLGNIGRGREVQQLARFYAHAIQDRVGAPFDVLFGPAYKGIPLVVATSMVLAAEHDRDVGFTFDRKERKDHGEGGNLIGHGLRDGERVLILEDVTTAGTSIRQTMPLLQRAAKVDVVGLLIAVDRQERGRGTDAALRELSREFGFETWSICTIEEVVRHLQEHAVAGERVLAPDDLERIATYRQEYGVGSPGS